MDLLIYVFESLNVYLALLIHVSQFIAIQCAKFHSLKIGDFFNDINFLRLGAVWNS